MSSRRFRGGGVLTGFILLDPNWQQWQVGRGTWLPTPHHGLSGHRPWTTAWILNHVNDGNDRLNTAFTALLCGVCSHFGCDRHDYCCSSSIRIKLSKEVSQCSVYVRGCWLEPEISANVKYSLSSNSKTRLDWRGCVRNQIRGGRHKMGAQEAESVFRDYLNLSMKSVFPFPTYKITKKTKLA